ncbi:MAG: DUF1569 domain-containing protein [Phycisphaerales bacterium]|nr:DUF1569 domain-containing protein [Phycisphaerales bacterium]
MSATQAVDTRKVKGRRVLKFATIDEMIRDAEQLGAAEAAGTLKRLGNWTLGQTINHMATWAYYAHDGVPAAGHPPWFVRLPARWFFKRYFLSRTMMPGLRPLRSPEGTLAVEVMQTPEALAKLKAGTARLVATAPTKPNPLLGPLTHQEWIALHLRHAELHLSFFVPR